jgi:hypothetical protein
MGNAKYGIAYTNDGIITGCYNTANVANFGICYTNVTGTIKNCYNIGNITSSSECAGICYDNEGWIIACYNSGNMNGGTGKAAGISILSTNPIIACYNKGTISGTTTAGICIENGMLGLVGFIVACYNTGVVMGSGICKENDHSIISDCYWTNAATGAVNDHSGTIVNLLQFSDGTSNTAWPTATNIMLNLTGMPTDLANSITNAWKLYASGGYWKFLGGWNNGNPVYPKLYWEN